MNIEPYRNPAAREWRARPRPEVIAFHRELPGYAPTRLVELTPLAQELGVGRVFVKEESSRLGLPAFKILGASYAIAKALSERFATSSLALDELRRAAERVEALTLVAATDGNHGRAVARTARLLGLGSRIFVPTAITDAAKSAITAEGATLVQLPFEYDAVVSTAARWALEHPASLLVQDTAWPGYEQVPQWIVDGYSTLFIEIDTELASAGVQRLDAVAVPVGVGSLAQAAVQHYRSGEDAPSIVSVEPVHAPAVLSSLHEGALVTVATAPTIMAGLNCGTPSGIAWPMLQAGVDVAVAVTDDDAARAVHDLEALGVDAGPCGAATLAGIRALGPWEPDATIVLLSTESRSANPIPA